MPERVERVLALPSTDVNKILVGELSDEARSMMRTLEFELYGGAECSTPLILRAMLACRLGARPEDVARLLDWREFESFCADLLRSAGFEVRKNVRLRRPTAQIDVVATGPSVVLSVDCKHWKRGASSSVLEKVAHDQRKRNELLRKTIPDAPPIVSVVITFAQQEERFVGGAAVVPLFALRSFLNSLDEYHAFLDST